MIPALIILYLMRILLFTDNGGFLLGEVISFERIANIASTTRLLEGECEGAPAGMNARICSVTPP